MIALGFIRDEGLGQTYAIVRRESDGQIVRMWVAPDSPLVYAVPWADVLANYNVPTGVIVAIPLDGQYPAANQLARRFDGGDDRIFFLRCREWPVAAHSGPGHLPGDELLLVRHHGSGRGLLRPGQHRVGPSVEWHGAQRRLPQLPHLVSQSSRTPPPVAPVPKTGATLFSPAGGKSPSPRRNGGTTGGQGAIPVPPSQRGDHRGAAPTPTLPRPDRGGSLVVLPASAIPVPPSQRGDL